MPTGQLFLGVNPGTTVKDALEPELYDDVINDDDDEGDWVEVNFPAKVVAVVELGTVANGADVTVEVQGADDDEGTNLVSYGVFSEILTADANSERVMAAHIFKPFVRALVSETGTENAAVRVVLRPEDYWQGNTRTA